jgi:hypothetical protein
VFHHDERRIACAVHGDDFTLSGPKQQLDWVESKLREVYELKVGGRLGPGGADSKEACVLNRVLRWTKEGVELEADPRQAEKVLHELSVEGGKSVATPGLAPTSAQLEADKDLNEKLHTLFRGTSARCNYLAADRPDVQYSAKEVCRTMAKPTELGLAALKRLGRFLVGKPRLVYRYKWQHADHIDIYSDTDWGGCKRTRKSTSGGCVLLGDHLIKSWSSTLPTICLSSAEAELYGVVKAAAVGLGYQGLLNDGT